MRCSLHFLCIPILLHNLKKGKPGRRPAQEVVYTREQFYREFKAELERSYYPMVKQRTLKKNQADKELAAAKDPWSIVQNFKDTLKNISEPPYGELLATTTLKFDKATGFGFQVYADFFEPTSISAASSRYSKNNFGFSFGHDLVMLFRKSQYQLNMELVDVQSRANLLSKDRVYLSHVLNAVELSYNLFSTLCEKADLEKVIKTVEGTLAVGQVQRSARTISTTEMLRIRSTYLTIKRQLDANQKQIALAQSRFFQISDDAYFRAVDLSKAPIQCEESAEAMKSIGTPDDDEIDIILKKYPSIQEINVNRDAIKKQIEMYRNSRLMKLNANLGYDRINNLPEITKPYDNIYVSLTLTYQFRSKEFDARNRVYAEQFHTLGIDQKIEEQNILQTIDDLNKTIRFSQNQIPVVQDSINNASQLLKIIETQQSIGQLDASAIDSAYQSHLSALSDMRHLGDAIFKAGTKLDEIRSATSGGRVERDRDKGKEFEY